MKVSASNIVFHELVGLKVTVTESSDDTLKGLSGEVIDETKNTLKIISSGGSKIIPKSTVILQVEMPDGTHATVEGKKIAYRPEDRIKRMRRGR